VIIAGDVRLDKAMAKAYWFRLVSVSLGNATPEYPDGDDVQAIEKWDLPKTWQGADPKTLDAILDAIDRGAPDDQRYSDHKNAKGRAAWKRAIEEFKVGEPWNQVLLLKLA
jgi:hypothetical protein